MLTELERAILDVESRTWRHGAAKEAHVTATLGLSPWRYALTLNTLIDRADALEYAPVAVNRLHRARQPRRRSALQG